MNRSYPKIARSKSGCPLSRTSRGRAGTVCAQSARARTSIERGHASLGCDKHSGERTAGLAFSLVNFRISSSVIFKKVTFGVLFFSLSILTPFVYADNDISLEAAVDKNQASVGEGIMLGLRFSGTIQIPAPEIPAIEWFQVRYLGPATQLTMVNGRTEQSVTHRYLLAALKEGVFRLGPFSAVYKGITYTSQEITLTINQGVSSQNPISSDENNASAGLNDRIFLTVETDKTKVFLNEALPLTIRLYVRGMALRDIQYPRLDAQGFTMDAFEPARQLRETYNAIVYDVVEFRTKIFAARTGDFVVGPAHLKCDMLIRKTRGVGNRNIENLFDDFFGSYESMPMDLKSSPFSISVLPFPEQGRPKDFTGTVGDFVFSASVSPKEVNVGDPITIKMAIKGDGNFDSVACPSLEESGDFKIYEPQVKSSEGIKEFEQVILPSRQNISEIPVVTFSFFNPVSARYETLKNGPFAIKVNPSRAQEKTVFVENSKTTLQPAVAQQEEILGKDILFIKTDLGNLRQQGVYLYESRFFWFLQGFIFMFFLGIVLWRDRTERLRANISYARRLQAPKKARIFIKAAKKYMETGQVNDFYDTVFKMIREYLGDRYHLSSGAITEKIIDDVLKKKNISSEILEKLKILFNDCDMARYAPADFDREKMASTFTNLEGCMDYFEKNRA